MGWTALCAPGAGITEVEHEGETVEVTEHPYLAGMSGVVLMRDTEDYLKIEWPRIEIDWEGLRGWQR